MYICLCVFLLVTCRDSSGVTDDRLRSYPNGKGIEIKGNISSPSLQSIELIKNEQGHSISYKMACVPSEDSDQPAHPRCLIRVFAGHSIDRQES